MTQERVRGRRRAGAHTFCTAGRRQGKNGRDNGRNERGESRTDVRSRRISSVDSASLSTIAALLLTTHRPTQTHPRSRCGTDCQTQYYFLSRAVLAAGAAVSHPLLLLLVIFETKKLPSLHACIRFMLQREQRTFPSRSVRECVCVGVFSYLPALFVCVCVRQLYTRLVSSSKERSRAVPCSQLS